MEEETQIATKEDAGLVSLEAIQKARQLSGEASGTSIPFVPVLKIANSKIVKKAIVEGVEQEVEVLCDQGFNITEKTPQNEYKTELFAPALKAVILKERYEVKSKWEVEPSYYSREFDNWNDNIVVSNSKTKELIAEGNYAQLKDKFKTSEKDKLGNYKKSFDLFLVLYVHILDNNNVYRLKTKMTGSNGWFDYKKLFGNNDTFVGYETEFNLHKEKTGTIEFWQIDYLKGEKVDLEKELAMQMEINEYFSAVKAVTSQDTDQTVDAPVEEVININEVAEVIDEEKETPLEEIPF